jgi:hypothetical protein
VSSRPTQLRAPAFDGRERLLEHDLEVRELGVDVVLGLEPDLAGVLAGLLDDPVGLPLGAGDHRLLGDQPVVLAPGVVEQPGGVRLGALEDLVALLEDPPGLGQLLGEGVPDVGDEPLDLGAVDHDGRRQRHHLGVGDQPLELVELGLDVERHATVVGHRLRDLVNGGGGVAGCSSGAYRRTGEPPGRARPWPVRRAGRAAPRRPRPGTVPSSGPP